MIPDRLDIECPIDDRRRERTARAVFTRLQAAPPAPVIEPRASRRWWIALAVPAVAAAVIAIAIRDREPAPAPFAPSLISTPINGSSRFTVGDVVVDAGPDTGVAVAPLDGSGTALTLLRGSVDCEVPKRGDRPPFRVVAGDVTVEVIGTRFTVARTGDRVRVDVTRGTVAVIAHGARTLVAAGESWSDAPVAVAPPVVPAPIVSDDPAPPVVTPPLPPAAPRPPSPQQRYLAAQRLEGGDPKAAALAYRGVADGTDRWAPLALLGLAELHASTAPADALREIAELERRFPGAGNLEDALWLRVDVLAATGKRDALRAAAADYLARYPRGTYAAQAARLARSTP